MSGFEGSYLCAAGKIGPSAVLECKVCWTRYDPAEGDPTREIEAGTAFADLPWDWSCPVCSSPKAQFLVHADPDSPAAWEAARLSDLARRLEADFREVWNGRMKDVPLANKLLAVEAVGLRLWEGRPVGVLVAPWCMNLVLLPAEGEDWSALAPGAKESVRFPSGVYEFVHNRRDRTGGYKACSLYSDMFEFRAQAQATEVARAILPALLDPANRVDAPEPLAAARTAPPSRRRLLSLTGEGG